LTEAIEGDRTDWDRVRSLSDADIDQAIATDADTFSIGAPAIGTSRERGIRFVVARTKNGEWRWRLVANDGDILAQSGQGFASRRSAITAIEDLRSAVLDSVDVAAA